MTSDIAVEPMSDSGGPHAAMTDHDMSGAGSFRDPQERVGGMPRLDQRRDADVEVVVRQHRADELGDIDARHVGTLFEEALGVHRQQRCASP